MTKEEIKNAVMLPIKQAGFNVYFVGGCNRDEVLGITPHDYDLCTNATPSELHSIFSDFSSQNSEIYGVTMPIVNGELVEIATLREDMTKGRHPEIKFTTSIEKDAARRDFTINALYQDIDGNILDPCNGLQDIKEKKLRFVGSAVERIEEDPLRLFRFCRFLSKGFISGLSSEELLEILLFIESRPRLFDEISRERKLKEIIGIFGGSNFMKENDQTFDFLRYFHLTDIIGLEVILLDMKATAQTPKWHSEGSVYNHTILVMKEMAKQEHDWLDMLAACLHDIGKPIEAKKRIKKNPEDTWFRVVNHDVSGAQAVKVYCRDGLGMSKKDCALIEKLVAVHMKMHELGKLKKFNAWSLTSDPDFDRMVKLCRADANGCIKTQVDEFLTIDDSLELPEIKELIGKPMPAPIITGNDLIEAGIKPCPNFSRALDIAYRCQVNNNQTNKKYLLKIAKDGIK